VVIIICAVTGAIGMQAEEAEAGGHLLDQHLAPGVSRAAVDTGAVRFGQRTGAHSLTHSLFQFRYEPGEA
jgi:hypothetical protein